MRIPAIFQRAAHSLRVGFWAIMLGRIELRFRWPPGQRWLVVCEPSPFWFPAPGWKYSVALFRAYRREQAARVKLPPSSWRGRV